MVLFGRDLDNLRRVQLDIRDLGANCYYYSVDISKREDLYTACDMMVKDVGEPDIVINNAGIGGEMGGLLANDDALLRKVVDTNPMSNFYLTKRFLPSMQARNWGHMMYVSSLAGMRGSAMLNCYATTKAAQISLQESVQCSLDAERSDGVTASVYCVGYVDTPMVQGFRQAFKIKSMLSVEQAAADMVRMVRRREHICFNLVKAYREHVRIVILARPRAQCTRSFLRSAQCYETIKGWSRFTVRQPSQSQESALLTREHLAVLVTRRLVPHGTKGHGIDEAHVVQQHPALLPLGPVLRRGFDSAANLRSPGRPAHENVSQHG